MSEPTPKLGRQYFIDLRNKAIVDYLEEVKSAPVKRGWNAFLRQSIPSKRDVTAACQALLKSYNDMCISLEHKPIWDVEDEADPGLKGKPVK